MVRRLAVGGLVAAACVVIAAGVAIWLHRPPARPPAPQTVSLAQAEETVQRAETSARLLACADLLADQPGCREQAQDLYDYVARAYGDAGAVRRRTGTSDPVEQGVSQ
jgi:hypothetical protein